MEHTDIRRGKQERLLELASVYKGFSRKQLADALGRDQTRIFPASGNPKLDYLVRLSEILDWPVGDVAESIWGGDAPSGKGNAAEFEALNEQARSAHKAGEFARMREVALQMYLVARTADERAMACHRESGAWDGLGRYTKQLEAVRRGLAEGPSNPDLRILLRVNLANSYYTLWQPLEARAMAREILEGFQEEPPTSRSARAAEAFAYYVLGHASRRLISQEPDRARRHATGAKAALERANELYSALAEEFDHDPWRGIAGTCRGGLIEVAVELGEMNAKAGAERLALSLDELDAANPPLAGDRLESYGWCCIFGCNIALRHLTGKELQRHMAVFTNKGYEIADKLNNWAMRERLFTLEFLQRERLNELAGIDVEWTIDNEEVRVIVGTMGRFPGFRSTGWRILETATVVGDN